MVVSAKEGRELRPLTFFNGKYGLEKDATCPSNNSIRHAFKRMTCPIVLLAFCETPVCIGKKEQKKILGPIVGSFTH